MRSLWLCCAQADGDSRYSSRVKFVHSDKRDLLSENSLVANERRVGSSWYPTAVQVLFVVVFSVCVCVCVGGGFYAVTGDRAAVRSPGQQLCPHLTRITAWKIQGMSENIQCLAINPVCKTTWMSVLLCVHCPASTPPKPILRAAFTQSQVEGVTFHSWIVGFVLGFGRRG